MKKKCKIISKISSWIFKEDVMWVKQGWAKLHIMKKIIEKLYLDDNVIKEISLNNKYYENLE